MTLRAISVLVAPGPEEGCPSARQVEAALAARTSAVQRMRGHDPDETLSVILPAPGSPQEPSFSLIDHQGRLRLFRTLARPGSARARDCLALSDTVALIVQRYLEEVELPTAEDALTNPTVRVTTPAPRPAPAPAAPESRYLSQARLDLSLAFTTRFPSDMGGLEPSGLRLSVARTFGSQRDTGLLGTAWGGISGWSQQEWLQDDNQSGGRGTVIRVPMGLGLLWRRAVSSVELQVGAGGLLDWWILRAMYQQTGEQTRVWDYRFAFAGAAIAGLQVPLGKRFFARASVDLAVAVLRYRYYDPFDSKNPNRVLFSTPLLFGDAGFALGMSLR